MKTIFQNPLEVETGERSLVGYFVFALLILISAAVGAGAGLLLVYSTDLPQVEQLEHYRPSTVTELYDDQNRVIGTFALQRRVGAGLRGFSPEFRHTPVFLPEQKFFNH